MELKQELEIVQISIYCDIVTMLLKEHKILSLVKLTVFSYLTKKENLIQNSVFRASNTKEIVNKYLSLLSGDLDNFFISCEYIIKAIHILIENEIIELKGTFISKKDKTDFSDSVFKENDFTKKVVEKAKSMSDKQFMREVLSNV
jgi:hypothetical protein